MRSVITTLVLAVCATCAVAAGPQRYIIFTGGDPAVNEAARQGVEDHGGVVLKDFANQGIVVLIPAHAVGPLAGILGATIEPDLLLYAVKGPPPGKGGNGDPPPQPDQVLTWNIDQIDAELVPAFANIADIDVAIIDTGIMRTHDDLAVVGGINFTSKGRKSAKPDAWDDDHGHGTHVAGIVGALDNIIGVIGAAPGVNLHAVKVLNKNGSGNLSDIIDALFWSADNGMEIVNMSLGIDKATLDQFPSSLAAFRDAVDAVYASGVLLVAAAGNSGLGEDTIIYPARFASVIAVGATDINNDRAWFSSTGPDMEIAAPGLGILSTWNDGLYNTISGTSMASPHVAGVAALFIADGVVDNDAVRLLLQTTADNLGSPEWFGFGLVDAEGI